MALREMIVNIVRDVVDEIIKDRFGEEPVVMEIARGPDGSILADHNNQCWLKKVSVGSTDDTSPLIKSDNYSTPIQVGLKVLYGARDGSAGKKEVLGLAYFDGGYLDNGEKLSSVAKHGHTHGPFKPKANDSGMTFSHDPVTIGSYNYEPLRTRPSEAGGLKIDVEQYKYWYNGQQKVFGGVTAYDLSSAEPGTANFRRYVGVYLDKDTNTIKTANGATVATGSGEPPAPTITDTNIRYSADVSIANGQTSFTIAAHITDRRDLMDGAFKISNVPYQDADSVGQLTTDDDLAKSANVLFEGQMKIGSASASSSNLHIEAADPVLILQDTELTAASAQAHIVFAESDASGDTQDAYRIGYNGGDFILGYTADDNNNTGAYTDLIAVDNTGKMAIDTATVNAYAKVTIDGANNSAANGPHIALKTDADANPNLYLYGGAHNGSAIGFDTYYNDTNWISTNSTSNFLLLKATTLQWRYDDATAGDPITWNVGLVMDTTGKVAIDTSSANAYGKLTIAGTNSSAANGPHIICISDADAYPQLQIMPFSHDNISFNLDAYWNDTNWISSDVGSNFQIIKVSDTLRLRYDSGVSAGGTVAWNNGLNMDTSGDVGIDITTPSGRLHVDQSSATGAKPVLYLDQADVSEEMIQFETTIGTGNAIEAVGAKTLTTTHFIKVTIPGGLTRYIPVGTIA